MMQLPVGALGPPFQSAAVPSAPTPSPSSSSPQHELPAVSVGMPAPAAASPGCAASPVRSASWVVSLAAIKTSRRRSARSGPAAGLRWNYPAVPPPPGQTQPQPQDRTMRQIRSDTSLPVDIFSPSLLHTRSNVLKLPKEHHSGSDPEQMYHLHERHLTCRVLRRRCRLETLWRTCCWRREIIDHLVKRSISVYFDVVLHCLLKYQSMEAEELYLNFFFFFFALSTTLNL